MQIDPFARAGQPNSHNSIPHEMLSRYWGAQELIESIRIHIFYKQTGGGFREKRGSECWLSYRAFKVLDSSRSYLQVAISQLVCPSGQTSG